MNEGKSLSDSDFVNEGMQALAVLLALFENKKLADNRSSSGLFCAAQGNQFLIQLNIRANRIVFLVKRLNDAVRTPDGRIVRSYQEILGDELNSILEDAKKKESRLTGVNRFDDLDICFAADPDDEYDEWITFKKLISIPSKAHVSALHAEAERTYPDSMGSQIIFMA